MTFWFVWITLGNSKTKNPVWTGCLGGATKKHRREAGNGWDRKGQEAVRGAPASELVCGATGAPHTWKTLGEHILRSYPTWESLSVYWELLPEMPGLPPVQTEQALGWASTPEPQGLPAACGDICTEGRRAAWMWTGCASLISDSLFPEPPPL